MDANPLKTWTVSSAHTLTEPSPWTTALRPHARTVLLGNIHLCFSWLPEGPSEVSSFHGEGCQGATAGRTGPVGEQVSGPSPNPTPPRGTPRPGQGRAGAQGAGGCGQVTEGSGGRRPRELQPGTLRVPPPQASRPQARRSGGPISPEPRGQAQRNPPRSGHPRPDAGGDPATVRPTYRRPPAE